MYATASGVISRPSIPDNPEIGRNTSTMMIVAKTIDVRISSVASRTTSVAGRWQLAVWRHSREAAERRSRRPNRVVDERPDGDRHSPERHCVDRRVEGPKDEHRGGQ